MAKKKFIPEYKCGECAHCTPLMRFCTLTVHGRRPTLGTCPYWTLSRCVLLSQWCCERFKKREQALWVMPPPVNTADAD